MAVLFQLVLKQYLACGQGSLGGRIVGAANYTSRLVGETCLIEGGRGDIGCVDPTGVGQRNNCPVGEAVPTPKGTIAAI